MATPKASTKKTKTSRAAAVSSRPAKRRQWQATEKMIAVGVGLIVLIGGYILFEALAAPANIKYNPGGFAPLIRQCESGGNYRALNKHSTASGAYQFVNGTWKGIPANIRGNYARAYQAPPAKQDAAFAYVWTHTGSRAWNASSKCWEPKARARHLIR